MTLATLTGDLIAYKGVNRDPSYLMQFDKFFRMSYTEVYTEENSAKCGKFTCKKQCEMREINMQKTVRNARNLCAKNSAKCVKFMCEKQCEMRQIDMQKTVRNASN